MDHILYIIRGLPGAGKSTLAKQLSPVVHEADDFFMVDGVYSYDPQQIGDAHVQCQTRVGDALAAGTAKVAVANTFSRLWEMEPYYDMANHYGYRVIEITVESDLTDRELAARNVHQVPETVIAKMRARFQPRNNTDTVHVQ